MNPVEIVGLGLSPGDLTEANLARIRSAEILVGGRRLLDLFPELSAERREIGRDLAAVAAFIRERMADKRIVVLASGDPLFFGIGGFLTQALGPENVRIHPNVSTVAFAFARIREPWETAAVISLHGRETLRDLFSALAERRTVAVYTDPVHTPSFLAGLLLEKRFTGYRICVLENLGSRSERIGWHALDAAASETFDAPNLAILKPAGADTGPARLRLGTPDALFRHRKGMITKPEIRAVVVSKLRLEPGQIVWDLGAGSGSVGIEASRFIGEGTVFAVEKDPERIADIEANRERFGVKNLEIRHASLPGGVDGLPQPDRIFIGGGGKDIAGIIAAAVSRLKPGGIVVVNTVVFATLDAAVSALDAAGFAVELIQMQIGRGRRMPQGDRIEAENPVWIVTGTGKEDA